MYYVKWVMVCVLAYCLSGCATQMNSVWPSIEAASRYKVQFHFPEPDHWQVVGQERDAEGYSRSWRPLVLQGASAEQSLYINFGRGIKTSLKEAMHQVKQAMELGGCKDVKLHVWAEASDHLTFTAIAKQCPNRHSVWQIFRVVNQKDGQYAVVYSANPDSVPVAERQQMAQAVELSKVIAQESVRKKIE